MKQMVSINVDVDIYLHLKDQGLNMTKLVNSLLRDYCRAHATSQEDELRMAQRAAQDEIEEAQQKLVRICAQLAQCRLAQEREEQAHEARMAEGKLSIQEFKRAGILGRL